MLDDITLTLARNEWGRIVAALDKAAEDAAEQGRQDRRYGDPVAADEMQVAADEYSELAEKLLEKEYLGSAGVTRW